MKGTEPYPPEPQHVVKQHFSESQNSKRPHIAPREFENGQLGLLKVIRHWSDIDDRLKSAIVTLVEAALDEKGGRHEG